MRKILMRILADVLVAVMAISLMTAVFHIQSYAKDISLQVVGDKYSFGERDHYEFSSSSEKIMISSGTDYGTFSIAGDIKSAGDVNGFIAYDVNEGNIAFSYVTKTGLKDASVDAWHLVDDKTKNVNDVTLDKNILSGALILQSSFDGETWITDKTWTDILGEKSEFTSEFYTTNDIQLLNGCYYRIIVAYKTSKKLEDGKFLKGAKYDYAKYAEVYSFYAISKDEANRKNTSSSVTPRKEFNDVVNTKKDTGYDIKQGKDFDKDDPHFGWKLGYFTVNGYTRETMENNGNVVFLKTVGDDITLWFTLTQDINCLNNNSNLVISDDNNGYDKNYQINQTDFKHGTLIVKYTDEEGNSHDPVIYTDFLLANTKTGADTKIQIYEEGEYEVALDYEIKNTPRKVGSIEVVPTYTNYKMFFKFSIRNGNTMVFPKDLKAPHSELKDGQITESGFSVDLAKSKYLTIDIVRETVSVNPDGTISLDVRNNTVGRDNGEYSQEGKYSITVKNLYSNGEPTTKVIYVGTNKYLRALANNKLTVDKLNDKILQGYVIEEDGTLTAPCERVIEEEVIEETEEETTIENIEQTVISEKIEDINVTVESVLSETDIEDDDSVDNGLNKGIGEKEKKITDTAPLIVLVVIVAIGGATYLTRKKKSTTEGDNKE